MRRAQVSGRGPALGYRTDTALRLAYFLGATPQFWRDPQRLTSVLEQQRSGEALSRASGGQARTQLDGPEHSRVQLHLLRIRDVILDQFEALHFLVRHSHQRQQPVVARRHV